MSYIEPTELVFNNDVENSIHAGGFNVNSIMMKKGFSPIMTWNNGLQKAGSSNQVSDIFDNLVIPSWVLSYHNTLFGGDNSKHTMHNYDDLDYEADDDVIDDDLHDKLLDLVKEHDIKIEQKKKRKTRKNNKHTNQKHKGTRKFQKV